MRKVILASAAIALLGVGAAQATTLSLENALKTPGSVSVNQTVGGRSGVATLDPTGTTKYANIWGKATGGNEVESGFGLRASANQGSGNWAGGRGALLSDIAAVSFDWYKSSGGLGGGFRLAMYVYGPAVDDQSGFLQFDLSSLLADQTSAEWNSTGNWLDPSNNVDKAWYSADYGSSQFTGYQSWSDIKNTLGGWSVYEIGIINDAGYVVSVDNLSVSAVPEPAFFQMGALLGMSGLGCLKLRRKA